MSDLHGSDNQFQLILSGKPNLFKALINQLNKDLATNIFCENDNSFDKLILKIEEFLSGNPNELGQILYRVDIEESKVISLNNYHDLATAILLRESQKVILRQQLSQ